MSEVAFEAVNKRYGDVVALDEVSLAVAEGELFALLGPSGSGKTTLLRAVAGFVRPDSGAVTIGGTDVATMPVNRRNIGMVFQSYALFPHLSVYENVAFGLEVRRASRAEIAATVSELLAIVRLEGLEARRPAQLSGGQQQRVALARALATRPRVLLLDEPLGALDKRLRQQMQIELRQIQREVGITTIFVTHDQEEALTLADRVAILDHGRVVQSGAPAAVYERPRTVFAADFLGDANFLRGKVVEGDARSHGEEPDPGVRAATTGPAVGAGDERLGAGRPLSRIQLADGIQIATHDRLEGRLRVDGRSILAVRPEKIRIASTRAAGGPGDGSGENLLFGRVESVVYAGSSVSYRVRCDVVGEEGFEMAVFEQNHGGEPLAPDEPVSLGWSPRHTVAVAP